MLSCQETILLVIDVQERLFPFIDAKKEFRKNLQTLTRGARILEIPIILTEQVPQKIGKTIPEISKELPHISPFKKITFSCCGDSAIRQKIKSLKRKSILLSGIETHVCVYQTAADLIDLKYDVHVVADAVSSRSARNKTIALERMKEIGVSTTGTEMVLCELLKKAEGKKFKEILNLIK